MRDRCIVFGSCGDGCSGILLHGSPLACLPSSQGNAGIGFPARPRVCHLRGDLDIDLLL